MGADRRRRRPSKRNKSLKRGHNHEFKRIWDIDVRYNLAP